MGVGEVSYGEMTRKSEVNKHKVMQIMSLPSPFTRFSSDLNKACQLSPFFFFNLFIYLFLAVLGLRFCARAFSSCSKRGPLFITVRGPLTVAASLVAEHKLQTRRLSSCGSRA